MTPRDPKDGEELDGLIADAFAKRGELLPTTEAEVRAAETDGAAFEGDLPPELRALGDEPVLDSEAAPPSRAGAASAKVVSLTEARRARVDAASAPRRAAGWAHVGTFVLGAAAAAGALLVLRPSMDPTRDDASNGGPATGASSSAEPPAARIVIPPIAACGDACCAGPACAAAQGELRTCGSGRSCIPCADTPPAGSAYRVRIGNVQPTKLLEAEALAKLDLCARVGGSAWSCEPAHADPTTRPTGRVLPMLASVSDITAGIHLELRPRGTKQVLAEWHDAVRIGPTLLCRGAGVLLKSEKDEHLGGLSLFLDDAHWVELARSNDVDALRKRRAELELSDVIPVLVRTDASAGQFALAVGPLDKAAAERLRWELLERAQPASVVLGADYTGAPKPLP